MTTKVVFPPSGRCESAWDWLVRSRQRSNHHHHDNDEDESHHEILQFEKEKHACITNAFFCHALNSANLPNNHSSNKSKGGKRRRVEENTGTGIGFIDQILRNTPPPNVAAAGRAPCSIRPLVFEILGQRGTGKTSLLLTLAASYLAATMNANKLVDSEKATFAAALPQVVLLDCDYGVHMPKLVRAVRTAILRRQPPRYDTASNPSKDTREEERLDLEDITNAPAPQTNKTRHSYKGKDKSNTQQRDTSQQDTHPTSLDQAIQENLSRIHLSRPCDTSDMMMVLEQLRHALDLAASKTTTINNNNKNNDNNNNSSSPPPALLVLIDSINSSTPRTLHPQTHTKQTQTHPRQIPHDLSRQLQRLLQSSQKHNLPLAVFVTKVAWYHDDDHEEDGFRGGSWAPLVTHRVKLDAVVEGTVEWREGFPFVAVSSRRGGGGRAGVVMPFGLSEDGLILS